MDHLINMGSRWVCVATHAVAASTFEAHMCGSLVARTTVGVVAVVVAFLVAVVVLTRIAAGRATGV